MALPGHVVQLDPINTRNKMFCGSMLTVTECKPWGVQGYVQALGEDGKPGGQAYYRAKWDEFELVGVAFWYAGSEDELKPEQKSSENG